MVFKFSVNDKFLIVGGLIAGFAALWHLLMILGGPSWPAFARAPLYIVESAKARRLGSNAQQIYSITKMLGITAQPTEDLIQLLEG